MLDQDLWWQLVNGPHLLWLFTLSLLQFAVVVVVVERERLSDIERIGSMAE